MPEQPATTASEQPKSVEVQKQETTAELLELYGDILEAITFAYPDEELHRVMISIQKDMAIDLSDPNTTISIETKKERDEDQSRLARGEDLGAWIEIRSGRKRVNINVWGGVRMTDDEASELRDSQSAVSSGKGHAQRTVDILSDSTTIDVNTLSGGDVVSITQLTLDRQRGDVLIKTLRVDGRYITSGLREGVKLQTSARQTIKQFDPLLRKTYSLRDK